jgi:hypothetical protein
MSEILVRKMNLLGPVVTEFDKLEMRGRCRNQVRSILFVTPPVSIAKANIPKPTISLQVWWTRRRKDPSLCKIYLVPLYAIHTYNRSPKATQGRSMGIYHRRIPQHLYQDIITTNLRREVTVDKSMAMSMVAQPSSSGSGRSNHFLFE